jgi:hypothetical protein
MEIPQKAKIELAYDQVIPLLGIYPKENKKGYNGDTCIPMFITALFTIASLRNNPRAPQLKDGPRKCGVYAQWNITEP